MQAVGEVIGCYTNRITGRETVIFRKKNLILNEGADIMAALLAGDVRAFPSHMYFHFENTNSTVTPPAEITRADGGAFFRSIDGSSPPHDWLRVPIITNPRISILNPPGQSGVFGGNVVTFSASSAASDSLAGESPLHRYFASNGGDGPSKVFGLALASEINAGNKVGDRVFSRLALETPQVMIDGSHLTFYWIIKFN
jgi:hypothetical protein